MVDQIAPKGAPRHSEHDVVDSRVERFGDGFDSLQRPGLSDESAGAGHPSVENGERRLEGRDHAVLVAMPNCSGELEHAAQGPCRGSHCAPWIPRRVGLVRSRHVPRCGDVALAGIAAQAGAEHSHRAYAIDHRVVRLHVQREAVVFDAFDDVRFPQWPVPVQSRTVETGDEREHLPVTARLGKRGVADVVVGIEFFVEDPVREPQSSKRPCKLLVERILHRIGVVVCREGFVQPSLVRPFRVGKQHEAARVHGRLAVLCEQKTRIDSAKRLHDSRRSIAKGRVLIQCAPLKWRETNK